MIRSLFRNKSTKTQQEQMLFSYRIALHDKQERESRKKNDNEKKDYFRPYRSIDNPEAKLPTIMRDIRDYHSKKENRPELKEYFQNLALDRIEEILGVEVGPPFNHKNWPGGVKFNSSSQRRWITRNMKPAPKYYFYINGCPAVLLGQIDNRDIAEQKKALSPYPLSVVRIPGLMGIDHHIVSILIGNQGAITREMLGFNPLPGEDDTDNER